MGRAGAMAGRRAHGHTYATYKPYYKATLANDIKKRKSHPGTTAHRKWGEKPSGEKPSGLPLPPRGMGDDG